MQKQEQTQQSAAGSIPWWREEVKESLPVSVPPQTQETVVRDIGEELEEEARQRALLTGNETIIPLDSSRFLRWYRRWFTTGFGLFVGVITLLMLVATLSSRESIPLSLALVYGFLWFEVIAFHFLFAHLEKQQRHSRIVLSRIGIEMVHPKITIGPIFWDEITEIRPYCFMGFRYIGIVPRDAKALAERLGGKAANLITLSDKTNRPYQKFGIFLATINIQAGCLPMTTEAFLEKVAAVRGIQPSDLP